MTTKGFTLVELIVTIGLLSLLAVLIASNMVSIQGKQLKTNYDNYQKDIAAAACIAIEDEFGVKKFKKKINGTDLSGDITNKQGCISNTECYVKTGELVNLGFLDKDLENPATGRAVTSEEVVRVRYVDGEKKCDYYAVKLG